MPKELDRILNKMQSNGLSKSAAIATAKEKGWIKQKGDSLELTKKGKKVAANNNKKKKG